MRQYIQNKPFLSSLLLNLGLFLVFLGLFYTRYGTTDDVEMQMVLAGKGIIQESSANLRWTHIFIGQVLSSLYSWFPDAPWYGWYLTTAHLLGMTAILYSIVLLKLSWFRIATFVVCFIVGETAMLQELQYTSSALVLGMGAVFLLFSAISNPEDKRRNYWFFASFLMLMVVEMMRWNSFQLIVILGTPLLLYGIFQQQQKRFLNLVLCTSILIAAWGVEQSHYWIQNQNSEWADYNRYKHSLAAHDILDYNKPQYQWTPSSADDYFYKVGWEYEDLMLFKHWFFADSTVFGVKQFKALQQTFQDCPYPPEHIEERLWQFFIEFPMKDYVFYGFLILGVCMMLIRGNRWLYLLFGASIALVFSILGFLFVYKHLPTRVSYPMAFYLIALAALFITYDKEILRKTKLFTLVFISFLALSNMKMVTLESSKTAFQKMYWSAALDSLNAQPEQLYIGGGDYYMQAVMTPYQSTNDSMFMNFNMLDLGHFANSPNHYKQLENFGIKNIHVEAALDTNIYIIHRYDAPFLKWYASFIYRHYHLQIEYDLVRKEEDVNVAVYRIKEQIREKPNSQGISFSNMHEFGLSPKDPNKFEIDPSKPQADYLEDEEFYFPQ
ncbi:hypothetical protein [Aureispira anguillae]|uniref:Uncharacterized protein n=1 Tax=Aureispira anguillae TaxID=2864201 RepID=A0A915YB12_9BACT|nr:hypothetical protein [Aureispira anguillae]BDS09763.1 hypothetical protein AsAng_0004680 [Aureispira anguillae]